MTTRFSVAVPAYNRAEFIAATLDAILAQQAPPDEVVVVDDGSTDATPEILQRYNDQIKVVRAENGGPGAARKLAVESCRNHWIALCDSDDIWAVNHLERFAKMIETCPSANILCANFVSFGSTAVDHLSHFDRANPTWMSRNGKALLGDYVEIQNPYRAFLEFNPIYPSGLAMTREIYDLSGGIKKKYSRWPAEDAEFTRRLVSIPESRVVLDLFTSWHYRRHVGNFSQTKWKNLHGRSRILHEHLSEQVVPEHLVPETKNCADKAQGQAFDTAFWTGHYTAAVELYRELPSQQCSLKRFLRRCLSGLQLALKREDHPQVKQE